MTVEIEHTKDKFGASLDKFKFNLPDGRCVQGIYLAGTPYWAHTSLESGLSRVENLICQLEYEIKKIRDSAPKV